jgi:hypothetical protein
MYHVLCIVNTEKNQSRHRTLALFKPMRKKLRLAKVGE